MLNWSMKPLTDYPSRLAGRVAEQIDPATGEGGYGRGMLAGMTQGVGDVVSGMTSPVSLATTAMGMPWLNRGVKSLASLGRIIPDAPTTGIAPSQLPPELIGRGMESGFNSARSVVNPIRSVEDLAYETIRRGPDPINRAIGGNFNVADMMSKTNRARGR